MDKWKIGVILMLLLGLAGYGFYQQAAESQGVSPTPAPRRPTDAQSKPVPAAVDLTGKPRLPGRSTRIIDEHAHPDDFGKSEGQLY